MAPQINTKQIIESLAYTVSNHSAAFALGRDAAPEIDGIHMISCGSGYDGMEAIQYLSQPITKTPVQAYYSSEYITNTPATMGKETLVVLVSKKGTTAETVKVAKVLKGKVYKIVCITKNTASEFATLIDEVYLLGETEETFVAIYMLLLAIVGGMWEAKVGWKLGQKLLSSLKAFPVDFADAAVHDDNRAKSDAERLQGVEHLDLIGSGTGMINANVIGPCILTEAHKIPTQPIRAGKVAHSMMEVFKQQPVLLLVHTEDNDRPLTKGLEEIFKQEGLENFLIYDTQEHEMPGVDKEIRPFLGAFVNQAFMKRVVAYLGEMNGTDTKHRNYMGRIKYWEAVERVASAMGISF